MKSSKSFKTDREKLSYGCLSESLMNDPTASILDESEEGLPAVVKVKIVAKRLQILAGLLQEKPVEIPDTGDIEEVVDSMVQLFWLEAFSQDAQSWLEKSEKYREKLRDYCLKKAWNDAMQYANKQKMEVTKHQDDVTKILIAELNSPEKIVSQGFNEWHRTMLEKSDYGMNVGLWQKFINMSFKYLYCVKDCFPELNELWDDCHCPVDSIILKRVHGILKNPGIGSADTDEAQRLIGQYATRASGYNWNNMNLADYDTIQAEIRALCQKLYGGKVTSLQFDFIYW